MSTEFEISKLLEISANQKYASTVAGFKIIDSLDQIEIPKKMLNRKPAVKAMFALSEGLIKWDFIDDETRMKLQEELKASSKSRSALDAVFSAQGGAAPVSDELDEDLDEIGETAPPEVYVDDTDEDMNDDSDDTSEKMSSDDDDDDDSDDDADDDSDDDTDDDSDDDTDDDSDDDTDDDSDDTADDDSEEAIKED